MSSKQAYCLCFTTVPSMIDLHPAEPLQEIKYRAYNLAGKNNAWGRQLVHPFRHKHSPVQIDH